MVQNLHHQPSRLLLVGGADGDLENLCGRLHDCGHLIEVMKHDQAVVEQIHKWQTQLIVVSECKSFRAGPELIRNMRSQGITTPTMLLTYVNSARERIRGGENEADDCLSRPVDFHELMLRIRCLLRRNRARAIESLRVADLTVDLLAMKASRHGRMIDLTSKEFQVLSLLAGRRGEVFSRDMLERQFWNKDCYKNAKCCLDDAGGICGGESMTHTPSNSSPPYRAGDISLMH